MPTQFVMKMNITIQSDGLKLHGRLTKPNSQTKCGVVFLHGGGNANATRYEYLQERLLANNIASLAFDMRGCGKSEGKFTDSSLVNREHDAHNAIKSFCNHTALDVSQIYLWGSSMGAHVACKLCNKFPFKGLILQSPATYGSEIEELPLNEEFTKALHRPFSWKNSPAIEELSKFVGKILVIFGQSDNVIPIEVKKLFNQAIKSSDHFIVLNSGTHTLLRPSSTKEQKTLEQLSNVAIDFIHNKKY